MNKLKTLAIGAFALCAMSTVSIADSSDFAGPYVGVQVGAVGMELDGKESYNFTIKTFEGETITLRDFEGTFVLLDFWSSWCGPCKKEAKDLNDLYLEYKDDSSVEIEFIGVNIWDTEELFFDHLSKYNISYPNGMDATGEVLFEYGVRGIPEKYLIDDSGNMVWKFVGPTKKTKLKEYIDLLLVD